jgi:hypothetical protein
MKKLVINVEDEKFDFINELLSNFSFVNMDNDWFSTLNSEEKMNIEKGLEDIKNGKTYSNEQVQEDINRKMMSLKATK